MDRRSFLVKSVGAAAGYMAWPEILAIRSAPDITRVTILHTNDVHSRIDPFPADAGRNAGKGGVARRASLIQSIREVEDHVLLFDSGDIFQGTPYFNFFGGEVEFKLMSAMRYDAATLGNHDFDGSIEGLVQQLPHADFPFVCSNYDFSDTALHDRTLPFKVFEVEQLKVGVLGAGIELEGLVSSKLYAGTRYEDPVSCLNRWAAILRTDYDCDLVICLSHLGYQYRNQKIDDRKLAMSSSGIDIILGGHTHTFMKAPEQLANQDGKPVLINQAGWAGILLGRIDVYFEHNRRRHCFSCENQWIEP